MNNEIVKAEYQEVDVPPLADSSLIAIADQAEKRLEAIRKIKNVALKVTNKNDWVDQNGKPYLQASGAEKVARIFGISWNYIEEPTIEHLEDGHFIYHFTGHFSMAGASIQAVGSRSSKDQFFSVRYQGKGNDRVKIDVPPSEIDRGDVRKSAFTNLLGNGITRLLGIRNLTWDEVNEYANINQSDVTGVKYDGKGKSQQGNKTTIKDPDAPASEAQIKAIHAMLGKDGINDDMAKCTVVSRILGLPEIMTNISGINKGQASKVIDALQKGDFNNDSGKGTGSETTEDKTVASEEQSSLGLGS